MSETPCYPISNLLAKVCSSVQNRFATSGPPISAIQLKTLLPGARLALHSKVLDPLLFRTKPPCYQNISSSASQFPLLGLPNPLLPYGIPPRACAAYSNIPDYLMPHTKFCQNILPSAKPICYLGSSSIPCYLVRILQTLAPSIIRCGCTSSIPTLQHP